MTDGVPSDELRADVRGLVQLLAKDLYAPSHAFVCELIQNAQDAIVRRRSLEGAAAPAGVIRVQARLGRDEIGWGVDDPTICFEDNGAGLTEGELRTLLAAIDRCDTDAFRQRVLEKGRDAEEGGTIDQSAIGLLSAFVVAHRVVLETRSCLPGSTGWRWESWGDREYALGRQDNGEPGTRVTLFIHESHCDVMDVDALRGAVRQYHDFLPVPVVLNDEGRINCGDGPWHRAHATPQERLDDCTLFVSQRYAETPLSVIPIDLAGPVPVQGALYIAGSPRPLFSAAGRVDVYRDRKFVAADDPDLLPPWAAFVRGVVDSPGFTPAPGRAKVQQDDAFHSIRDALGRTIVDHLVQLAREAPSRFQSVLDLHSRHLKGLALGDAELFAAAAELLPFATNRGTTSLRGCLEQATAAAEGERRILYLGERGQRGPFFTLADARGVPVIDASDVFDAQLLRQYAETHAVRLEQLESAGSDLIFQPVSPAESEPYGELIAGFGAAAAAGDMQVRLVRFAPATIPAILVLGEAQRLQRQMQDLQDDPIVPLPVRDLVSQALDERPAPPATLYVNADNPALKRLRRMDPRSDMARQAVAAVLDNALALAWRRDAGRDGEAVFRRTNRVIDTLTRLAQENDRLRARVARLERQLQDEPGQGPGPSGRQETGSHGGF